MDLPKYDLRTGRSRMDFEFVSEGVKGSIVKLVQYTLIGSPHIYNLSFGDRIDGTNEIDDQRNSNNGDSKKVLATVAATIYGFTEEYPEALVYVTGSTKSRNRLYQICIGKFLDEIEKDFYVFGLTKDEWQPFRKGNNYDAFLIKRKKLILIYENKNT